MIGWQISVFCEGVEFALEGFLIKGAILSSFKLVGGQTETRKLNFSLK